jgi:hypothetical protein
MLTETACRFPCWLGLADRRPRRPAAASERIPISSGHSTTPPSGGPASGSPGIPRPANAPPRPGSVPGPAAGLLGRNPQPRSHPPTGRARQPPAIALADQLRHRLAGSQKPRQATLVRGALADQRQKLLLLMLGQGGLLAWTAAATLLAKPCPAILTITPLACRGDTQHPGLCNCRRAAQSCLPVPNGTKVRRPARGWPPPIYARANR